NPGHFEPSECARPRCPCRPATASSDPLESDQRVIQQATRGVTEAFFLIGRAGFEPADTSKISVLDSGVHAPQQPIPRGSKVRRWLGHLFREWTIESWRPFAPAFAKPEPSKWSDTRVTLSWLGHSTVLINFFGVTILTDPVLFPRIGIPLPGITIGPKRPTSPSAP